MPDMWKTYTLKAYCFPTFRHDEVGPCFGNYVFKLPNSIIGRFLRGGICAFLLFSGEVIMSDKARRAATISAFEFMARFPDEAAARDHF